MYAGDKTSLATRAANSIQLSERGTYFVTGSTYEKAHHFRGAKRLAVLQRGLLKVAHEFDWQLEAWAVFSQSLSHRCQVAARSWECRPALKGMLGMLHVKLSGWINKIDKTPARQVWYNYWDTKLTHQRSYLARLNMFIKMQ